MTDKISIEAPVFYGDEDENIFFSCIYNLPGFKSLTGKGTRLNIEFNNEISDEAREQIDVLIQRWNTKESHR